eukprot:jgi/Chrzof1/870/Cz01g32050.t1
MVSIMTLVWVGLLSSAHIPTATGQGLQIDDIKSTNLGASSVYQSFQQHYGASKAWKSAWTRNSKEVCSKASGSLCASNSNNELSEPYFTLLMATSPATFNNRDPSYTGVVDVVKPPKDQHPCKACVGFAAISAAETAVAVVLQKSVKDISLSVQDLQYCSLGAPRSCRTGWELEPALKELQDRRGILADDCLPYAPDIRMEKARADICRQQCSTTDPDASQGRFSYVPITEHWHAQRHIRHFGNVVTPFHLTKEFRDFFGNPANKNKVYKPGPNTHFEEGHAVVLVGYNNEEEYWVVKNSWGPDWADGGFFKVAYGTSGILDGRKAFGVTWEPASPSRAPILVEVDAANPACKTYVAQKGDYISKVAKMFNVELEALLLDNQQGIQDLDEPLEGKKLRLCSVPANVTLDVHQISTPSSNATRCVASKQHFLLRHNMTDYQVTDHWNKEVLDNLSRMQKAVGASFYKTPFDSKDFKAKSFRITTVTSYYINGRTYYTALYNGNRTTGGRPMLGVPEQILVGWKSRLNGYCPGWINAFTVNDKNYYNALWEKPSCDDCPRDWILDHEIIGVAAFQDKHNELKKAGYRALWVSGYGSTEHKFAAIRKEARIREKWALHHNMRASDLIKQINISKAKGWHPVLINGYAIKGATWYVAILEPVGSDGNNTARYGMTESEYKSYEEQQVCAGYTPVHISTWMERQDRGREGVRFAAIWKQ